MSTLESTPKESVSPRNSGVPLLQREDSETPKASPASRHDNEAKGPDDGSKESKSSKRSLFGLGKKKKDERSSRKDMQTASAESSQAPTPTPKSTATSLPPPSSAMPIADSPQRATRQKIQVATSPHRRIRSTSPRMHSPATSQIFERDVQETASLAGDLSSNIPSHITTENYIPPVLEASSLAITDEKLDPDSVEILTHSIHQPAAVTVTGGIAEANASPPSQEELPLHASMSHLESVDDGGSNYGSFDNSDPRRLSFISFADVVQSEHVGTSRDSIHLMSQSSTAPSVTANRSPSPVRSPVSGLGTSPPTSGAASFRGMDSSPSRGLGSMRMAGSPTSASSPPFGGELMVETMRQALDKTGGSDIHGLKPLSAVSSDDAPASEQHPFK
jgi:hypothetical protein